MTPRQVIFTPEARTDLNAVYDWIADQGSEKNALSFATRIERYCMSFDIASERGRRLGGVRRHLRMIGFDRRATIIFEVKIGAVTILRIFRAGQNWTSWFQEID